MTKAIITINGRTYDAITGMPVTDAKVQAQVVQRLQAAPKAPAAPSQAHKAAVRPAMRTMDVAPAAARSVRPAHAPAQAVHQVTQKSHTLYRKALKKPDVAEAQAKPAVERSPSISKFATEQAKVMQQEAAPLKKAEAIAPASVHPHMVKIMQQQAAAAPQKQLTGSDLKEQLIKERLAEVSDRPEKHHKKVGWLGRQQRMVTILSSTLALLILGGYLTYITLPSISLRVAASRAGVNANMPEYKPDGYSLDGPITYSPGEVVISYKSNTEDTSGYKIVQKATNWDSQAVLDNYVAKLTDNYLTFQERGVTVYTFGNKAAWVNGGLLYTIEGNAALSSDQILRVATSI
jgi:hypothetical protein